MSTAMFALTQTPASQDAMWSQLRAAETQRAQYQMAANAAVARSIGEFHNRVPYADPGVALSLGSSIAQGRIDPGQAASLVDQSTAQGNRPAWTAKESVGLVDAMRMGVGLPSAEADRQATLQAISTAATAKSDKLVRDPTTGAIDQAATLKAAGVDQGGGGAFDWTSPGDFLSSATDNIGTAVKGATREALSVAQSGWEEVQNRAAQGVKQVGDIGSDLAAGDVGGAGWNYVKSLAFANPFGASEMAATGGSSGALAKESLKATNVAQQIAQYHELGSVDLGSGFFPGGTVTHTWQPEMARDVRGVIPGTNQAWTPGRAITNVIAQPGTKQYDIFSGLIDGAAQFAFDPSIALSDAAMAGRAGAKLIEAAPQVAETVEGGGEAATSAARATAAPTALQTAMNSPEGRSVILDLKNAKSPQAVYGIIGTDIGSGAAQRIAATDNWVKIRGILQGQAKLNPEWGATFAELGGDAAAHVASTVTPDVVKEASSGVLIDAERPTVNPMRADQLLEHSSWQPFLQRLADTSDPLEVMQRIGPKAPPSLISAVRNADTIDDVKSALRTELGLSIRTPEDIPGLQWSYDLKRQVRRALPGFDDATGEMTARSLQTVPARRLEGFKWDATPLEQRQTLDTINDALNTVNVSHDTRASIIGDMADAFADGSKEGKYTALKHFGSALREGFISGGMNEDLAAKLSKLWQDTHDTSSLYGVDAMARPTDFGMMSTATGNANLEMISPAKLSEGLSSAVDLPDFRQVRRLTSKFGRLISDTSGELGTEGQKLVLPLSLAQAVGEDVFPRVQVMRVATAVRIFIDEQARLAVAGLPNFITHPFQMLSLVLGSSAHLERLGVDGETVQRMLDEVGGSLFKSEAPDKVVRATRATGSWIDVPFDGPQGVEGGLDMARQFQRDPISQLVAQGKTTDEIVDWLHSAEGSKPFGEYVKLGQNAVARDAETGARVLRPVDLTDDSILRGWIDQNIRGQVDAFTKGNTELRNAIGYNRLGEEGVNAETGAEPLMAFDNGQATPDMERLMREWTSDPESPERVKWNRRVSDHPDANTIKRQWDRASGTIMSKLFDTPLQKLTRSPLFREQFYQRVAELAPRMAPEEANRLLGMIRANASDQGFAGRVADFLGGDDKLDRVVAAAGKANGDLTVNDVFTYAKGHAIDAVHDVLFDASQKTNLEQTLRSFVPFTLAWREVLSSWVKLLARNPGAIRRVQTAVQGARGAGFFSTDPVSGDERFSIPGSDWLVHQLAGGTVGSALSHVPGVGQYLGAAGAGLGGDVSLGGNVKDLNIVSGSFLPGLGPLVQFPAAHILGNVPQADFVRGLLMPYGTPTDENTPALGEAGAYFLPGWAQKVLSAVSTSPDSASSYGNTYAQVVQNLASSGKYGTGMDDRRQMLDDAKNYAKVLTVLRGLGQFTAPASPSYDMKVATKEGDVLMGQLASDFHTMQSEDYDTAVQRFLDTYGEGPFVAAVSKTKSVNGGLDASSEFGRWERDHGATMGSYPAVAGFFAPVGSDFDFEVWNRQMSSGQRKKLSGDELVNAAQATLAEWKYRQAQAMLGDHPNVAQLNWLTEVKAKLQDQYPGYGVAPGNPIDFSTKIQQLTKAQSDPALKGDVQTALATYLYFRNQALASAQQRAGGRESATLSSDKNADLRAWLAGAANQILAKYPSFARMFDGVLASEVNQ